MGTIGAAAKALRGPFTKLIHDLEESSVAPKIAKAVEGDAERTAARKTVAGAEKSTTKVADDGARDLQATVPAVGQPITARPGFAATAGRGGTPGSRPCKDFTRAGKDEVVQGNAVRQADGKARCASCDTVVTQPAKSQKGVTPDPSEAQVDHVTAKSKGGSGDPSNGACLCRSCNRAKSDR